MLRRTLNLGILAHVDAGKTTLTERLLYAAGIIDEVGSVDKGTTQTDTLELERRRGITIKSAVVSFQIDDVTVNLIDTPGHPDFIAEVERVLGVLDGAVLVISAVEGVQPQTRLLMRALQRLRVPTLVFVNKIDRAGADEHRVLESIAERLTPAIVPLGTVSEIGTRAEPGARPRPQCAASALRPTSGRSARSSPCSRPRAETTNGPSSLLGAGRTRSAGCPATRRRLLQPRALPEAIRRADCASARFSRPCFRRGRAMQLCPPGHPQQRQRGGAPEAQPLRRWRAVDRLVQDSIQQTGERGRRACLGTLLALSP